MLKLFLLFILVCSFYLDTWAKRKVIGSEEIGVQLSAKYDQEKPEIIGFNGDLGVVIEGSSDVAEPKCKFKMLFRKVTLNSENQIECWTEMECMKEQQKIISKLKKIYLKIKPEPQKISLKYPNKHLKILELTFAELSLKTAKK